MEIAVKNQNGETVETVDLDDAVFNVPMNHALVHQALVIYQLNKRQGTHDTKTRAQVSGGGRKPWIQKHTGRARQGSIRAPQWRHGGVVFGPHPRSYRKGLPRRFRRMALRCVLSDKARQNRLICLSTTDAIDGKTRSMVSLLQDLEITGSALVVTREAEQSVIRAAHNLKKIWTIPVALLNAHELLRRDTVIMTLEAARWAEQFLGADTRRRGANQVQQEPEALAIEAATAGAATEEYSEEKTEAEPEDAIKSSEDDGDASQLEAALGALSTDDQTVGDGPLEEPEAAAEPAASVLPPAGEQQGSGEEEND